jgi:hypothetical protein
MLLLTNRSIFNELPVFMLRWKKEKAVLYPVEVPPPIADSFNVATMARKHSVLNLQEINRNNKHTAHASCELITDEFP